jgi:hypothetical protein
MIGEFRTLAQRGVRANVLLWIAGEIFIVVAGVLIAFGLNAWWVERSTRVEEQTHLRALARDFEQNVSLLTYLLEREEEIVAVSLELLQLARKQPHADAAVVSPLIGGVFQSHRAEPAMDAYQALVNSAGLTLIRDEQLRSDLAGFAARSVDPYAERYADELYMTFTTRFIGRLNVGGVLAQDAPIPESYSDLLSDPVFQEHLAFRHFSERQVATDYRQRLREAQGILVQLRTQIRESAPDVDATTLEQSSE